MIAEENLQILTALHVKAVAYSKDCWTKYKRGNGPERGNSYWQGLADGADEIAMMIDELIKGSAK